MFGFANGLLAFLALAAVLDFLPVLRHRRAPAVWWGEERLLFAKALDQAIFAMKRREPAFTDFMDRAKCARFRERLQGLRELEITLFGGTEDCERQMMGFFTEPLAAEEFPIKIVKIRRKKNVFIEKVLPL